MAYCCDLSPCRGYTLACLTRRLEDKRDWLLATASWAEVGRSEERIVNHLKEIQEAEKRRAQTAEQVRKAQTTLDSVRADQARKVGEGSTLYAGPRVHGAQDKIALHSN